MRECKFHMTIPGRNNLWEELLGFKWDEDACCQSFPLCFSSRPSRNPPKEYSFLPLLSPMRAESFLKKKISFPAIFLLLPTKTPIRPAHPLILFLFSHLYPLSRPKFVSLKKGEISYFLSSFLLILFLNLSIQKQSSPFRIPLQNLPRRVSPSLNSNGKFPCKNMKFFKVNNWMNN